MLHTCSFLFIFWSQPHSTNHKSLVGLVDGLIDWIDWTAVKNCLCTTIYLFWIQLKIFLCSDLIGNFSMFRKKSPNDLVLWIRIGWIGGLIDWIDWTAGSLVKIAFAQQFNFQLSKFI